MPEALPNTMTQDRIDPADFRALMGQFATGVCVISVPGQSPDEAALGMTVNSFVSVSLEPMLVSWSIQNSSTQFAAYTQADVFAVSILAQNQRDLARRFASRGNAERKPEDFELGLGGLPVVKGSLGYLECKRWSLYPAGDHTMIFGEVVGIEQAGGHSPLGFFGGEFCRIAD